MRAFLVGCVTRLCCWIDDDSVVIEEMQPAQTHDVALGACPPGGKSTVKSPAYPPSLLEAHHVAGSGTQLCTTDDPVPDLRPSREATAIYGTVSHAPTLVALRPLFGVGYIDTLLSWRTV